MRVHIATDHAGFELKEKVVAHLREAGHDVVDHGAHAYDALDDYPPFCIEAAQAVADGADEIDMVINIELVKDARLHDLEEEIAAVRRVVPAPRILKVIIESAALTDDEIVAACTASMAAGADFVKTSTGFHPAGGASTHAVALMRATVGDALGVKASGGIRDAETALAMIEAGASRLGVSATNAILAGLED